ncbi:winged helix-turn-helix domain-containing protein [Crenalkalicoccus roseus]|uniref:winged helix-turn-helix domain-containing protein n=1 Tax=Crenalkalicoccus roseus TaxID=1485588 RepID=UPI0010820BBF|nr:LysR family transcriptional regulator [Crenalkalicoccus roseus]
MPRRPAASPASRLPITLRLDLSERVALGPGKAALLEAIRDTGSIAAAGRRLGMSYQRAHDLVSALNRDFAAPLVEATVGGARGGGARLSALGEEVLATYREVERAAITATEPHLNRLRARLRR